LTCFRPCAIRVMANRLLFGNSWQTKNKTL
jgi:hypothetical protein